LARLDTHRRVAAQRYGGPPSPAVEAKVEHLIVAQRRRSGNQVLPRRPGHSTWLRRLTGVGQNQPAREQIGCLFRCGAIEGHQGRRHPGQPPELRPPLVANRRDFNLIRASADIVLEAMNVHRKPMSCVETEAQILRGRYVGSSEARREESVHMAPEVNRLGICQKKNLRCQLLHRFCTIHAQVFHNDAETIRSSRNTIEQVE